MDKTWMNEIDAENLNEKYKEVFILYKKIGMTQKMVAEELDCTPQNISLILNSIKNKEPKAEKQKTRKQKTEKRKSKKRTTASENYQQYKSADLSILTDREKEIITLRMEGKANKQIAEALQITPSSVGATLNRAKTKLEGKETYQQKNRELINARMREKRRTPEQREKEYKWRRDYINNHPEFKEHLKAYQREYYLRNKERILEKAKKRRNDG